MIFLRQDSKAVNKRKQNPDKKDDHDDDEASFQCVFMCMICIFGTSGLEDQKEEGSQGGPKKHIMFITTVMAVSRSWRQRPKHQAYQRPNVRRSQPLLLGTVHASRSKEKAEPAKSSTAPAEVKPKAYFKTDRMCTLLPGAEAQSIKRTKGQTFPGANGFCWALSMHACSSFQGESSTGEVKYCPC